ncbi:MAG: D-alanine--D-alanine ligase [Acidobacteriota bacterium]|nr:D-alanine--D-alanine ligase [Acidobacteriota bacterium]
MKKKLRIGVLFGGRSGEHEISLISAASILKAIDRRKYDVVPIGISKAGQWLGPSASQALLAGGDAALPQLPAAAEIAPDATTLNQTIDVVFPVLHGTFGEDGTVQGLLELADIAYVGSGVLSSAAGMDKDVMKKLFAAAGLPQTPYLALLRSAWRTAPARCTRQIEAALAYPLFVKPANAGSSVGISKVHDRTELDAAMELAATYDRKIVVEQGVGGPDLKPRELEVAVLGNDAPEASVVGEIIPAAEFYDYEAKYHSDDSIPIIPARLTAAQRKQIRSMALAAYQACECSGLARVDFLLEPARRATRARQATPARIYVNELNTMPGFTSISMYPKLWKASGLPYKRLIDRLIQLALERHREKQETQYSRQ